MIDATDPEVQHTDACFRFYTHNSQVFNFMVQTYNTLKTYAKLYGSTPLLDTRINIFFVLQHSAFQHYQSVVVQWLNLLQLSHINSPLPQG
jgi:hypothetical protein